MFLADFTRHLNDHACVQTGGIGNELTEVCVIGLFKLVFDYDNLTAANIASFYIDGEVADGVLSTVYVKLQAKHFSE